MSPTLAILGPLFISDGVVLGQSNVCAGVWSHGVVFGGTTKLTSLFTNEEVAEAAKLEMAAISMAADDELSMAAAKAEDMRALQRAMMAHAEAEADAVAVERRQAEIHAGCQRPRSPRWRGRGPSARRK